MSEAFDVHELRQRVSSERRYSEFLRVPTLSAGIYLLPAGANDTQSPHNEDEIYYVVRGRGKIRVGTKEYPVHPGSVVFVEAHAEHRFFAIEQELSLLVMFAPAETSS